jgi:acetate---CoA ligase (ADP-forming)
MDLAPLLAPRSIAVVGANDRPGSYADNVLSNLERWEFEGPVWGVNPKRAGTEIRGRPCVAGLSDLPERPDAVVIAIPAAAVPAAIREAGELGCGGAVVISAGFGEIDAGVGLEAELREAALAAELPICGPNGNGIVSAPTRAPLWGDSVQPLEPGPIAMVSQSGNVAVNALGSHRGIRWHTLVSTGNQTVCDASDWLAALCELDGVRSVAMFLESDGDGPRFAEALAIAAERGVGVAVLKVGASAAGASAAAAHTGSLAGDQRVFRALVGDAGAAWARDPHELLEMARALSEPRARPHGAGGAAVLTCSGGDSGVAADEAERAGLELPPLAESTREALAELLPHAATIANPLDYTAMIWGDSEALRRIVVAVGADPAIDQLLLIYDHPHDLSPENDASWARVRAGIVAGAAETGAATLVASTLPDLIDETATRELGEHGVPAIAGLATALACARELRRPPGDPARLREIAAAAGGAARPSGDDGWIGEIEAKELLRAGGVAVPDGRVAADADEAVAAAREIGWPVAMKLSAPALLHKSDAGALALSLTDEDAVREADARLRSLPVAAGAQVLVERMTPAGIEVFVAARADGVVPALAIGLGGIWAEAFDDVAIVPLPASTERVEHALHSLRASTLLTGRRGSTAVDLAALAALAARVGELALDRRLVLLELNPVAAGPDGAVALDALARAA